MPKEYLNKDKIGTAVVRGTITARQRKIIQDLIGVLGSNEQDVVGKILVLWMYNEGFLKKNSPKKVGDEE